MRNKPKNSSKNSNKNKKKQSKKRRSWWRNSLQNRNHRSKNKLKKVKSQLHQVIKTFLYSKQLMSVKNFNRNMKIQLKNKTRKTRRIRKRKILNPSTIACGDNSIQALTSLKIMKKRLATQIPQNKSRKKLKNSSNRHLYQRNSLRLKNNKRNRLKS